MGIERRLSPYVWTVALMLFSALATSTSGAEDDAPSAPAPPSGVPAESESEPPGYRTAVEQALSELRVGHFSEARAMFLHAHELLPSARTLRGLGLAEFELRSYVESIEHLEQALASTVRALDPALREETVRLVARASRYVTRLELAVSPATATVTLNGAVVAEPFARPLRLAAGDHLLELSAPGRRTQRRRIHALGGDTLPLSISLAPLPLRLREEPEAHRPLFKNPWLWVGIGALAAGAATAGGVLAAGRAGDGSGRPYGGTADFNIKGL